MNMYPVPTWLKRISVVCLPGL